MRGKQHKIIAGRMMDPSTPAYAGQTSLIFAFRLRRSLYPRICGANTASDLAAVAEVPLPPHMRGKPASKASASPGSASTPAYAGQTPYVLISPETSRLYPRICGANGDAAAAAAAEWPLPPHMRGKLALCTLEKDLFASTPAYAGQTWFLYCALMWTSLYPRICGANS